MNITRGKALGGRLNAHLAYSERIDHMGEQLRDARNIFKMSEKVPPPLEALRNEEASGNHQVRTVFIVRENFYWLIKMSSAHMCVKCSGLTDQHLLRFCLRVNTSAAIFDLAIV